MSIAGLPFDVMAMMHSSSTDRWPKNVDSVVAPEKWEIHRRPKFSCYVGVMGLLVTGAVRRAGQHLPRADLRRTLR